MRSLSSAGLGRIGRSRLSDKSNSLGVSVNAEPWDPSTGSKNDLKYESKSFIYQVCESEFPCNAAKLTGMLSQMSATQRLIAVNDEDTLKIKIHEAVKVWFLK